MRASADLEHPTSLQTGWRPKNWLVLALLSLTTTVFAGCQASPKNEFASKYKKIQLDMSEEEVDQILASYPCYRCELEEYEKRTSQ